jgi:hypothetical protein
MQTIDLRPEAVQARRADRTTQGAAPIRNRPPLSQSTSLVGPGTLGQVAPVLRRAPVVTHKD